MDHDCVAFPLSLVLGLNHKIIIKNANICSGFRNHSFSPSVSSTEFHRTTYRCLPCSFRHQSLEGVVCIGNHPLSHQGKLMVYSDSPFCPRFESPPLGFSGLTLYSDSVHLSLPYHLLVFMSIFQFCSF